ncbi:zinc-dependent peptidase [Ferruginibacter sp.]|uniref:M90 family metallopeptidase n=1 Tax=Ferruginibacter sp. TaxID=1940288 RepID=UPI001998A802|nr:M90 family metallopeptidase [Ferruginibacter sp.]MBC7628022.1 zinc-dependent peptidase [Ferruginibacter sp.]
METVSLIIFVLILFFAAIKLFKKKTIVPVDAPPGLKKILTEQVPFYQQLLPPQQIQFQQRMLRFLAQIKITGVKTIVEDIDRIYIAASAIIPVFNFKGWEYFNLHEVLLYPDSFDDEYKQQGAGRTILGMVGNGAMNHVMILSQQELRQAFTNTSGKENTAIHEFVHLIDKTDGDIDGVPASLVDKKYIVPWLQLMHSEINRIKEKDSDINPYGATNESEFFAVASEYFFERPDLFSEKHPELFQLMEKIFKGS